MKNQQGAPEALTDFERRHAIRQGHEIAASDGYFEARPQIDSNDRRKVFQAGFERGWDRHAALVDAQQPAPSAAVAVNDEQKALKALHYYMTECSGHEPSLSVFHRMAEEALAPPPSPSSADEGGSDG